MGDVPTSETMTLDRLVAHLWSSGEHGRSHVRALLSAIETVAPEAVDQVQARRIGRLLGLAPL